VGESDRSRETTCTCAFHLYSILCCNKYSDDGTGTHEITSDSENSFQVLKLKDEGDGASKGSVVLFHVLEHQKHTDTTLPLIHFPYEDVLRLDDK